MENLGKWLTFKEAIHSSTASRKGIDNTPTEEQYKAMQLVYQFIYVPLCEHFGKLPVSSFFRCKKLNTAVGGSKTSQHMKGQAIDIDCDGLQVVSNKQLYQYVKENLDYDQIGYEYPDKNGNPGWVHISYLGEGKNRKTGFTAS